MEYPDYQPARIELLHARPEFRAVAIEHRQAGPQVQLPPQPHPAAAQQADLDHLLEAQQDPSSPQFRQWLTPEEYADRYDRLFGTPHGVDLAALCAATRTPHLRVTSLPELEQALASPNGGVELIEAVVRRDNRRDLDERIRALGREV